MSKPSILGDKNPNYSHGHTRAKWSSSTYRRWGAMIQRCTNPKNKAFKYYGARGILVCERWLNFENFLSDMGEPPTGSVLDRTNNDAGYCKENCRWTTTKTSAINRRMAVPITHNGKTQCVVEWAAELGMRAPTIYSRIQRGETDPTRILAVPPNR